MVIRCFAIIVLVSSGASMALPRSAIAAAPSPGVIACAPIPDDQPNGVFDAFAYDLQSRPLLRFISELTNLPKDDQKRVFDAALAAASTAAETDATTREAKYCQTLEAFYATSRVDKLISRYWDLDRLGTDDELTSFSHVIETAIVALAIGDTLPPTVRTAALTPFAKFVNVDPSPLPATGDCAPKPAAIVKAVAPEYPDTPRAARTFGSVFVKLGLDEFGDVENAQVYTETLGDKPGAEQLKSEAVIAAAASTYSAEATKCVPFAGHYVYKAVFEP